ncbi:MAG: class I SAM-dependent methyltransferase [Alphaproteobacteria bacterium]
MAAPSPWVERFAPMIAPGGTVLDLACGEGRHVALLRRLGHKVAALDRDTSRMAVADDDTGVEAITADLEDGGPFPLRGRRFAGIVVTNYLHRPLFPELIAALAPGGVLIYETFARGNERFGRPRNPQYLLAPGELLAAFAPSLRIVAYEHGQIDRPRQAVVSRLCALLGPAAPPPLWPGQDLDRT